MMWLIVGALLMLIGIVIGFALGAYKTKDD